MELYKPDTETVTANFKQARLLVIEDNDDYWTLIQRAVDQILPEVSLLRAASREEAQRLFTNWSSAEWEMPRLVLLDLCLPWREQGWQVLHDIRQLDPPRNQVPVVILSHSALQADIDEAYRRGSSCYLVKPIFFDDLLTCLQQIRQYWWEIARLPLMYVSF